MDVMPAIIMQAIFAPLGQALICVVVASVILRWWWPLATFTQDLREYEESPVLTFVLGAVLLFLFAVFLAATGYGTRQFGAFGTVMLYHFSHLDIAPFGNELGFLLFVAAVATIVGLWRRMRALQRLRQETRSTPMHAE